MGGYRPINNEHEKQFKTSIFIKIPGLVVQNHVDVLLDVLGLDADIGVDDDELVGGVVVDGNGNTSLVRLLVVGEHREGPLPCALRAHVVDRELTGLVAGTVDLGLLGWHARGANHVSKPLDQAVGVDLDGISFGGELLDLEEPKRALGPVVVVIAVFITGLEDVGEHGCEFVPALGHVRILRQQRLDGIEGLLLDFRPELRWVVELEKRLGKVELC